MIPFTATTYPHTTTRAAFAPHASDEVHARVLAAGTAVTHAIPAGATHVLFSASGDFFARLGGMDVTTAVPAATISDGTAGELSPAARTIGAGQTHIALVAPANTYLTLAFYGTPA